MTRTLTALALAGVLIFAVPAGAHPAHFADGSNDGYEAGDTGTTAHTTPLDLAGATFSEKPGKYKFTIELQNPLDVNLLCSETACSGKTIESHGVFNADFYRFVDDARKNWYFIEAGQDGDGNLVAGLFKVTANGSDFVTDATVSVSDDLMTVKLSAPRIKIKGHTEGRKIYWNTTSVWWEPASSDHCVFNGDNQFANACVDWIPDASDAPHKLQN